MSHHTNSDNIYKVGAIITAREDATAKLLIVKYYQRIYYCASVGHPERKHRAYFERELIAPG